MSNAIYIDAQSIKAQVERLKLDFPELEDDADLLAYTVEGETDFHEVLTRLVRQERDAAAFAEAIKAQEQALNTRRARFEKQQQFIRQLIHSLLDVTEQRKVMLPEATLSISQQPPKAFIQDEWALPDEFVRIKRFPNMNAVSEALKSGKNVPGARLTNGSTTLTIRVK